MVLTKQNAKFIRRNGVDVLTTRCVFAWFCCWKNHIKWKTYGGHPNNSL